MRPEVKREQLDKKGTVPTTVGKGTTFYNEMVSFGIRPELVQHIVDKGEQFLPVYAGGGANIPAALKEAEVLSQRTGLVVVIAIDSKLFAIRGRERNWIFQEYL